VQAEGQHDHEGERRGVGGEPHGHDAQHREDGGHHDEGHLAAAGLNRAGHDGEDQPEVQRHLDRRHVPVGGIEHDLGDVAGGLEQREGEPHPEVEQEVAAQLAPDDVRGHVVERGLGKFVAGGHGRAPRGEPGREFIGSANPAP
jgi:hypothetical protein